jgi:hypothetical protein
MIRKIGSNMREVECRNGTKILVSYETPVAARIEGQWFKTEKRWSLTTSRHISKWLCGVVAEKRPQAYFWDLFWDAILQEREAKP